MRMHDTTYLHSTTQNSSISLHSTPPQHSRLLRYVLVKFYYCPIIFRFVWVLVLLFQFCIPLTIINSSNHIIYLVLLLDGRIKPFSVVLFKNGRQGKHLVLYLPSPPFCFQSINSNWNLSRKKCTTFWNQTSLGIRLKCYYLFGYHDFFRDSYFILMIMMIIVLTW